MKKTYIQPAILLTKVAMQQMICGSNDPTATINPNGSVDADKVESRGSGFWDDDEE